ncbi:hypothetical protein MWE_0530 [Helicobacter pylori XZ274]|nr:hypothetical protein MWE_0530 [Helicobacter pylori XZ274]
MVIFKRRIESVKKMGIVRFEKTKLSLKRFKISFSKKGASKDSRAFKKGIQ